MDTYEYIRVKIRVYNNNKNLVWIFITGYYILPNLWEFRPQNSRQAWIEECSGTQSHVRSSNPTGGILASPRNRCDCQLTTRVVNVATLYLNVPFSSGSIKHKHA